MSIIQKTNYEVDITYRYFPREEHKMPLSYLKSDPITYRKIPHKEHNVYHYFAAKIIKSDHSRLFFIIPDKSGQINCGNEGDHKQKNPEHN